ncbi:MAG: hypothetical protein WBA12_14085 [Catalinimonas sp.]
MSPLSPPHAWRKVWPFFVAYTLLPVLAADHFFFWDTVQLASKHAHWYWDQNFRYLLLPDGIDSGHPPLFGMYIALGWKLFGRSLVTSHLLMLPFAWLIVWQAYRLVSAYVGARWVAPALALVLAEPSLPAQLTLVSPDAALMAFFLWAINAARRERRGALAVALTLLALVSMRGMMCCVVVFAYDVFCRRQTADGSRQTGGQKTLDAVDRPSPSPDGQPAAVTESTSVFGLRPSVKYLWPYAMGALPAVLFLVYHYVAKGWVGYHADSPWAPSFERVGAAGVVRNVGLVGWRLLDFGRVFVWVVGGALGVFLLRKRSVVDRRSLRELLFLTSAVVVMLTPTLVLYRYLVGHRYLMPHYLAVNLLVAWVLFRAPLSDRRRWGGWSVALVGLLTGHLWVYPDRIAQGWDATLAHWGYYEVRRELMDEVRGRGLDPTEVGSDFPNLATFRHIDLAGGDSAFVAKDLTKHRYVLWTNVYNGFTDAELAELEEEWTVLREARSGLVRGRLYSK